jgi:hypothetical protein
VRPHRLGALTERPFVYSRGRKFIITTGGRGGGQGRSARERTNYLSAMLAPASLAEAAICSATASHVEFVGETLKCRESPAKEPNGRKKGKCSLARDNRIMESAWRFFLVLPNELAR